MRRISVLVLFLLLGMAPLEAAPVDDPLKSTMWNDRSERLFADAPVEFDARVKVIAPSIVENEAQVPLTADARQLDGVQKLIVFADLNPIQHVLTLFPAKAAPYVSFRMKVERGTPVRAAALTSDGVWHVGGIYLDAAGGGCSAPAMARKDAAWSGTLGQTHGRLWREAGGLARARFRVRHPMDTGLARDNTPAYFIERIELKGAGGERLAALETFEPLSEDPTLTLLVRLGPDSLALEIEGRDNNGRIYRASLAAPPSQSRLAGQEVPVP